jgi:hypothetical protein
MRELVVDGSEWTTKDDVYNAFFRAVCCYETRPCKTGEEIDS